MNRFIGSCFLNPMSLLLCLSFFITKLSYFMLKVHLNTIYEIYTWGYTSIIVNIVVFYASIVILLKLCIIFICNFIWTFLQNVWLRGTVWLIVGIEEQIDSHNLHMLNCSYLKFCNCFKFGQKLESCQTSQLRI